MTSTLYPSQLEADVVLKIGRTLRLRPIRPDDRDRLLAFFRRLSTGTIHARFFDLCTPERAMEASPVDVDYDRDFGIIAEHGDTIVGVAHYFASKHKPVVAEVAFVIADDAQGCGVGTKLLDKLVESSATANGKTMLATFMGANGVPTALAPVPAFSFPERAANALARVARYAEWRERPGGNHVHFDDIDRAALRSIIDAALQRGGGWLDPIEVRDLLRAARIAVPPTELVTSAHAAMEAAIRIGFPVALKVFGPNLLHKSDVGGVRLGLKDEWSVVAAYDELTGSLGNSISGIVVQAMVSGGVEVMLGATLQPTFGHVIAFGAGGTLVEILSDVSFRMQPMTDVDADDLIASTRCARILRGVRGARPADINALREAILRLAAIIDFCPEIVELDINPLKVLGSGVVAIDARVRVEAPAPLESSRRVSY